MVNPSALTSVMLAFALTTTVLTGNDLGLATSLKMALESDIRRSLARWHLALMSIFSKASNSVLKSM